MKKKINIQGKCYVKKVALPKPGCPIMSIEIYPDMEELSPGGCMDLIMMVDSAGLPISAQLEIEVLDDEHTQD